MKKDVIYIDVEDDITAISEKIKASKAGIVALVPPRRLGVLQSIVNLKLLKRAAEESENKLVLITSDRALMALTAGLQIPVARNLQSRPEIIPAVDDADDTTEVIEGELGDEPKESTKDDVKKTTTAVAAEAKKPSKKFKVPNFEKFRKKAFLIGGGAVLLIAFLVWAIVYAPKGTVVIKAETDKVDVKFTADVDAGAAKTDPAKNLIKPEVKQEKATLTQTITPTGKKELGEKAKGTITIKNCDDTEAQSLASGSQFSTAGGLIFVSTQAVTVPGFKGSASACKSSGTGAGVATVPVEAKEIGEQYNVAAQGYTIPGISDWEANGSAMSGGTKREVTVVTQTDVDKAKQQLLEKNPDPIKQKLGEQFDQNTRVIEGSFSAEAGEVSSQPGVDQEAAQATVSLPMTYTILGVKNDDISALLSANVEKEIDSQDSQRVYDNGYSNVQLQITDKPASTHVALQMQTTGRLGPNINTDELAKQIAGKRYGEIEAMVTKLPGVKSVETDFSPFWVTKAPKAEKITIKLEVADGS